MLKNENPAGGHPGPGCKKQSQKDDNAPRHKNQDVFDAGVILHAIESAGLTPPDHFINDGNIHRFPSSGNKLNQNGYYCFYENGGGFFGCWKSEVYEKINPSGFDNWTDTERKAYRHRMHKAKAEAQTEQEKKYITAAGKARQVWESAKPADPNHPYLKKKQIKPHDARQTGKTLIYPIEDTTGKIFSLQSIDETGKKKFFPGGRISGGSCMIGYGNLEHGGFICEGPATGCSIFEATGKPVIVAFTSGNLSAVAKDFKHYPLIIAADNDLSTFEKIGKNPGVDAAQAAADVSGLPYLVCPVDSDFNDMAVSQGLDAVKKFIAENKPTSGAADTWPDPLPLFNSYKPEPFPIDALPPIFRNAVDEVRDYVQAPIPMIISSALGAASIAVQGHYDVKRDEGLTGPVSLFLWVVADSGERKTTVDNYFTAGIRAFESEKRQEMKPEIDAYEREMKIYKAKEDGLLQAIKQAKASEGRSNGKN